MPMKSPKSRQPEGISRRYKPGQALSAEKQMIESAEFEWWNAFGDLFRSFLHASSSCKQADNQLLRTGLQCSQLPLARIPKKSSLASDIV